MANIIKQNAGQVSSNGTSLAIYVDVSSSEVMIKDVAGNTQPLRDFLKESEVLFIKSEKGSFKNDTDKNIIEGYFSCILSGEYNVLRANHSSILGGNANTIAKDNSTISGGKGNEIQSENSFISNGLGNKSFHNNTNILGSGIETNREDTTFVENLSIMSVPTSSKGLPKGSVWSNKGVLSIVT